MPESSEMTGINMLFLGLSLVMTALAGASDGQSANQVNRNASG
jgi:hypothetical protein